jgi:short-subunit dehydrogenase
MPAILITGASSGLGEALARAYAGPGTTLYLLARRAERLVKLSDDLRKKGATPVGYEADVRDRNRMQEIARDILGKNGLPDLIVANAGIRGPERGNGSLAMEAILETNVLGVLYTVEPFLPDLRKARKGQIAVVGSLAGYRGLPEAGAYCASKAALAAWTGSLRYEMEGSGVSVSLINPGFVQTEMTRHNPYPMPFLLSAPEAARKIRKGLERKKALIEPPFPLAILVRLLALLPPRAGDRLFGLISSGKN